MACPMDRVRTRGFGLSPASRARRIACPGRWGRVVSAAFALLVGISLAGPGQAVERDATEYNVKAAFLYNFASYVEWPAGAFSGNSPFVLGVVGRDPFGATLDTIAAEKSVGGRAIVVRRFNSMGEYVPCHMLFVSSSEAGRLTAIVQRLAGAPVLLVADTEDAAHGGVAVNFFLANGHVRFEINQLAAKRAGLTVSSKLLRLATIVDE
jgi:hypothetical protein